MDIGKTKTVTEIIKNFTQVVALIVAGVWAYTHFLEAESPSLEVRSSSESTLDWYHTPDAKYCLGRFGVSIKNIGKESFNIDKAIVRIWLVNAKQKEQTLVYLDPRQLEVGKPLFEKEFSNPNNLGLLGHFPPGVSEQYHFTFNFKNSVSKFALFSFEGVGKGIEVHETRWSYLCDVDE